MPDTTPLIGVTIARQHEDGTLTPVEADHLPEDLQGRCVRAIEQYRAEYGTAPNALVIAPTGQIIASQQSG